MKKFQFLLFIWASFYFLPAKAQVTDRPKGNVEANFGITDANLIDRLMWVVPGIGGSSLETLTEQTIKPYLLPVRRMEGGASEMAYALASCLEYYVNLDKNYKINLSPDYISILVEQQGKTGGLPEAFRFLAEEGTVDAAILPFGSRLLSPAVHATPRYRISNYLQLYMDITKPAQRVYDTRKALLRGNPVLVDMRTDPSILSLQGGSEWLPQGPAEEVHTFLVVGYNENKRAFEIRSSWGSAWGKGGYIWVPYDQFGKLAINGYVMVPPGND